MKIRIKIELILNFMKEQGLNKKQFCKLCGIGMDTLNKLLSNNVKIRLISAYKIAKTLSIRMQDLIEFF